MKKKKDKQMDGQTDNATKNVTGQAGNTELVQLLYLACGTPFRSSCAI